ncbi:MAG: dihydropteroate synthase [Planctomycetota bacterium]
MTATAQQTQAIRRSLRKDVVRRDRLTSLTQTVDVRQDNSYLIVGERTNTNGSRQFKRLLQEEDWDGLVSMARDEVRGGSMILDVCVDFVGRDGVRDMHEVVRRYVQQVGVPLMLDSTDPKVLEAGLKLAGGRCALNSTNLEEGEEKFGQMCELARKYGALLVCGTIDEDPENAMGRTEERKISIAKRIRDLAVEKYGLRDGDLMFDPLVLPISTGLEEDRRNALETIEGTRRISEELPGCHTTVGLSNISFGLRPAARQVLNSVFLSELRDAGLTSAIVHASKILPKTKIDDERWDAALDLIYDRRTDDFDPLTAFVELFPDGEAAQGDEIEDENLTLEEKLERHIIDGEKRNLTERLDEAMGNDIKPLAIINDILLKGMKVVGDLFGRGEMQLPFVLQSAETMKAAVAHLEPHMDKVDGESSKGVLVLATVKGDVHDIGKNLVDILLTNNGYTVHNIGIKKTINEILDAYHEHKADAIGMSGLLVKSVAAMKDNLAEMNDRKVAPPVLLGGAALTREYVEEDLTALYEGPVLYCKDAFAGLRVMDYVGEGNVSVIVDEQADSAKKRRELKAGAVKPKSTAAADIPKIAKDNTVPHPPFWGSRVVTDVPLKNIFGYINEIALFNGQWGFKKKGMSNEAFAASLADAARPTFERLKQQALAGGLLDPKVTYGYFPVQSDGDDLIVYDPKDFAEYDAAHRDEGKVKPDAPLPSAREICRFTLPRQDGRRNLCISDFFRSVESKEFDVLGLQLVTMGQPISDVAEKERAADKYQEYLYLHGFGVECAEALAEMWHKRMRSELGFASDDATETRKLFQQKYRGSRYSFGYPACPNLEDRTKVLELLQPDVIDVHLTEEFMLDPEQSTDALVVHHPQAKYFDV